MKAVPIPLLVLTLVDLILDPLARAWAGWEAFMTYSKSWEAACLEGFEADHLEEQAEAPSEWQVLYDRCHEKNRRQCKGMGSY